jgi:hypothetical protein
MGNQLVSSFGRKANTPVLRSWWKVKKFQHTSEAEGQQHKYRTVKGCLKASKIFVPCILLINKWIRESKPKHTNMPFTQT